MRLHDYTGKRFGRLVALEHVSSSPTRWRCACDCGREALVTMQNLKEGNTISCGCYREEQRKTYARRRDYTGPKNPKAKKSASIAGEWVPSSDVWYKRAAGVYYSAKKKNTPLGFASAADLALYLKKIAPAKCPVFGEPFTMRGVGFSAWSPSVDKIDPKLGYVRGNIQVVSMLANCMKRDASPEQLKQFALWVLKDE